MKRKESKIGRVADEVVSELMTRFNARSNGDVIVGSGFSEKPPRVNIYLARDLFPEERERLIHRYKDVDVEYRVTGLIRAQLG